MPQFWRPYVQPQTTTATRNTKSIEGIDIVYNDVLHVLHTIDFVLALQDRSLGCICGQTSLIYSGAAPPNGSAPESFVPPLFNEVYEEANTASSRRLLERCLLSKRVTLLRLAFELRAPHSGYISAILARNMLPSFSVIEPSQGHTCACSMVIYRVTIINEDFPRITSRVTICSPET